MHLWHFVEQNQLYDQNQEARNYVKIIHLEPLSFGLALKPQMILGAVKYGHISRTLGAEQRL